MRKPEDLLELADELIENDVIQQTRDERTVEFTDQLEAARKEANETVFAELKENENLQTGSLEITPDLSREGVAWALALERAIISRTSRLRCPHWTDGSGPRPLLVDLSQGWGSCNECGQPPENMWMSDDGVCDICDEPADFYTPLATQAGAITVVANVCDECFEWVSNMG